VDELEERTAAEAARERPEGAQPDVEGADRAAAGRDRDLAHEVPGAPEPPD
jgi:hypothetical protein